MIRIDIDSVHAIADTLNHASMSCDQAATESRKSRDEVVSSVERIALSQRRAATSVIAMGDSLDLAEHKVADAVWEGESYKRFSAELERHRAALRHLEQQYEEAFTEAVSSFDQLHRRIVQLDQGFGDSCAKAGATLDNMAHLARRHADEMRDLVDRDLSM